MRVRVGKKQNTETARGKYVESLNDICSIRVRQFLNGDNTRNIINALMHYLGHSNIFFIADNLFETLDSGTFLFRMQWKVRNKFETMNRFRIIIIQWFSKNLISR